MKNVRFFMVGGNALFAVMRPVLAFLIVCIVALVSATHCRAEEPEVNLRTSAGDNEINSVHVTVAQQTLPLDSSWRKPLGALGRTYWRLSAAEREQIPEIMESPGGVMAHADTGGSFDLWDAVRETNAGPDSALALTFTIISGESGECVLGIGCSDEAFLVVANKTIFATVGDRDLTKLQNLVKVKLRVGANRITIICRKAKGWKVMPEQHERDQWRFSCTVFSSETRACSAAYANNSHMLDTPIVARFDDFRVDWNLHPQATVSLYDLEGRNSGEGHIDVDGIIHWSRLPSRHTKFVGLLSIGSQFSEPIVVLEGANINRLWHELQKANADPGERDSEAWRTRLTHLFDAQFIDSRDRWWARKVTLGLLKVLRPRNAPILEQHLINYRPAHLQFEVFHSAIDNAEQYYLVFNSNAARSRHRPVVAMLPTVNAPVRNFIESADIANIHSMEIAMSIASEYDLTLLWPGIVDVDYGGNLARNELDESIAHFSKDYSIQNAVLFLLGTCSSGVTAIGYAETRPVSGVVLETPMVSRWFSRWFNGLAVDDVTYPWTVLADEQTSDRFENLRNVPVFMEYSTDVPGHGDRVGCRALCDTLVHVGGEIDQEWPKPENDFLYGELYRAHVQTLLEWISKRAARSRKVDLSDGKERIVQARSVKDALIQGFVVQPSDDPLLARWLKQWSELYSHFRGGRWTERATAPECSTLVCARRLSRSDVRLIAEGAFVTGDAHQIDLVPGIAPERVGTARMEEDNDTVEMFGFRLVRDRQALHYKVEVFRSIAAKLPLPNIDLLVDGPCKGALWLRRDGKWRLARVWL